MTNEQEMKEIAEEILKDVNKEIDITKVKLESLEYKRDIYSKVYGNVLGLIKLKEEK